MAGLDYDVVVVGAGPAGSSAALAAAEAGASVALIEKEAAVAETVRTSGVTWIRDAGELGIPAGLYNPVGRFSFCSPGRTVSIGDGTPAAAVLDVRGTYRWLAGRAVEAGASLFTGTTVTGAITEGGAVAGVETSGPGGRASLRAGAVVDASGHASVVARGAGLVPQWEHFGAGAEYEARVGHAEDDRWWLMVGRQYSPAGYAWIFPLGGNRVRIGVGVGKPESGVDPAARLDEIIEKRMGPVAGLGGIEPYESHYGLIPNDGTSRRTVFDGLVLVGDSAGQANPLVLEGIRYAIRFGRGAGRVAAAAVAAGGASAERLRPYEEGWRRAVGSRLRAAGRVQQRWMGLTDAQWDDELGIIEGLGTDEFLDFVRADLGRAGMAGLVARHPGMAARRLFGLARDGLLRGR